MPRKPTRPRVVPLSVEQSKAAGSRMDEIPIRDIMAREQFMQGYKDALVLRYPYPRITSDLAMSSRYLQRCYTMGFNFGTKEAQR